MMGAQARRWFAFAAPGAGAGAEARSRPARSELIALAVAAVAFAVLGWTSLVGESVTFDEFSHLPVGLSILRTGEFRLEQINSPLIRMITALPLLRPEVKLPLKRGWADRDYWVAGDEFMAANADHYQGMLLPCRAVAMALGLALIILCWWWARRLYGPAAGLAAAVMCAFDPNLMAYARLATTDLGAALTFFGAVMAFWAFSRRPSWGRAAAAGALFGVALLSKFTSAVPLAALPVLAVGLRTREQAVSRRGLALRLALMAMIVWVEICSIYLWQGVGRPAGSYRFEHPGLQRLAARLPSWLPVPLPAPYVAGVDYTLVANRRYPLAYILGETPPQVRPWHYLFAVAVKTPLPTLALFGLGLASLARKRSRGGRNEAWLVVPAVLLFALVALTAQIGIRLRYVLPIYPLGMVLAARLFGPAWPGGRVRRILLAALPAAAVVSSLLIYPHYLAYFNAAAGGPSRGYKLLLDSNLDWGQDLIGLKNYLDAEHIDHVCLLYFGRAEPSLYGINSTLGLEPEKCDTFAVSVSFVAGISFAYRTGQGVIEVPPGKFKWLAAERPDRVIGYTIWVYRRRLTPPPGGELKPGGS